MIALFWIDVRVNSYIAIVLKGYPRLSETFIAQEILSLQQRGYRLHLVSLRHPTDSARHPVHEQIKASVNYLPEYLHHEPWRVMKALFSACRNRQMIPLLGRWARDWWRDPTRNRIRRLGQALVMARELPPGCELVYAHFLHTPSSVAMYASALRGLPWAASAHAKDIWTSPEWELKEKLQSLRWLVTCTQSNHEYLQSLATHPERVVLQYHGLDLTRFPAESALPEVQKSQALTVLSVGRAVPKKGYPILLEALAQLPEDIDWKMVHIGGGGDLELLKARANSLGLGARIEWMGAQPQAQVLAHYRAADLFVLASVITANGDRDGLPNVLMEAQSQGLCCVASDISGVPELITHKENGYLVPSGDIMALAEALSLLLRDDALRQRLAAAGQSAVETTFSHDTCMQPLLDLLGETGRDG